MADETLEELRAENARLRARLRASERVSESERGTHVRDLARVLMDIADPIFIEDLEGNVVEMNEEAVRAYGWSRQELVGKPIATIVPPSYRAAAAELLASCRNGKDVRNVEGVRWTRNGKIIPVLTTASRLSDASGGHSGILVLSKDVTALKVAEARLRELSRAVMDVADSILILDPDGVITEMNEEVVRAYGWSRDDLVGEPITSIVPDDHRAVTEELLQQCLRGEYVRHVEGARRGKSGEVIPVLQTLSLMRDDAGAATGIVSLAKNITAVKRAEEERRNFDRRLQEAQKMESLAVLAGGIAHDFNNMLVAILGNAGLARRRMSPESPGMRYLVDIETAAEKAAQLINQMLAYSGRGRFVVEAIDVNLLIEEMTTLLSTAISKKAVVKFNLEPNIPPIEADATQIRQIVMNLITNASDAIGNKSGVIAITTGIVDADAAYLRDTHFADNLVESTYVFIEVSDTGCGMDEETRQQIFDPFFSTKFTGRGLGLAAVLGIVRGHRGALKVYSEPRKGTTFKILLPPHPDSRQAVQRISGAGALRDYAGEGVVLVIDDDETVCAVAKDTLTEFGFSVMTAPDGRQGIQTYEQHRVDIVCVLLDLTMPHMDGTETFRKLRQLNPAIRVILMSGYNEQDAISEFAGKGLAAFVQKPYKPEALVTTLREVLERA